MKNRAFLIALGLAALAFYLAMSSIYVVNEGEQALVVRLGAPVAVVDQPGLKFKAPFIDSVYVTSTRSLLLEPPLEQVIMGDEKRLEVQPYARFRIVDPLRFYQALRTNETANAQLAQLVSSSTRRALGQGFRVLEAGVKIRIDIIDPLPLHPCIAHRLGCVCRRVDEV